jgi:HSP20 family protein
MITNSWDVVRELASVQERMNRVWGNLQEQGTEDVTSRGAWQPLVDIYQTDGREIVLKAELPGLRREDIDLSIEKNTLTIRGDRRREPDIADEQFHRVERTHGPFSRSFTLPTTVDPHNARAEYRDGVLTVKLPLQEEARPRHIAVDVQG